MGLSFGTMSQVYLNNYYLIIPMANIYVLIVYKYVFDGSPVPYRCSRKHRDAQIRTAAVVRYVLSNEYHLLQSENTISQY